MNVPELIRKKRNGGTLTKEEIKYLISGYTKKEIPDYQFSAFLMAVYFNGMITEETAALTEAMLYSGIVVDLSSIDGIKIDKHSTGGVGDKTSLIIAPVVAAAGIKVPMISGRGLGHTGGTLDKLESIPGFRTDLNLDEYKEVLKKCGAVLIGQTEEIAPADKLIYSLRDVTATVESIPLITSSIMSKKLAEGIDGLVLDVKTGCGAFMRDYKDSRSLAFSLMRTAEAFGKKVIAFITDMNQPLGNYIGNWLEVYESIEILKGKKLDTDLADVSLNLSAAMLMLGNKAADLEEGNRLAEEMIISGKAYEKFLEIVAAQGGDISYIESPEKYPASKYSEKIYLDKSGFVSYIDTFEIGIAALELGAGRRTKDDKIDPKAGIIFNIKLGDEVNGKTEIAQLFTDSSESIKPVKEKILNSLSISNQRPEKVSLIRKIITTREE
ncbi:MAG: thymidine phosphorylase [Ignavibacteriaceae bacterium]